MSSKNKDLELDMSVALGVVYMFDELEATNVIIVNDDDHTDEQVMTTDLMSFEVQFSGHVDVGQVQSTPQPWTLFRDKARVEPTSTCDISTNYRLNIHTDDHHLREDRPDNETSEGETVGCRRRATLKRAKREGSRGLMYVHPISVLHANGRGTAQDERTT